MQRVVALIPCRAGSKRVPGKNVKHLCGKPLLHYVLQAALGSSFLNESNIYLISNDTKALRVALHEGVNTLKIPDCMAQDDSPVFNVLSHALDLISASTSTGGRHQPDFVCYLRATSPFVSSRSIENAISILSQNSSATSVVSVQQVTGAHPSRFKSIDISSGFLTGAFPEFQEPEIPPQSATLKALVKSCAVTVLRASNLQHSTILGDRALPMVVNEVESIDINTQLDFEFSEFLMSKELYNR